MSRLKGSKTAENLLKAFAGESQARMRYNYYASVADKEGYKQIRDIFNETAGHEKEHAKRFYNFLLEGLKDDLPTMLEINAQYPVAQADTFANLIAAAEGELEEWDKLYPEFADTAQEEGFSDIAVAFRMIADAEKNHEDRFRKLADNIKNESVFKKDSKIKWKCSNCGYVAENITAPALCPACLHKQEYFEVFIENY